MRLKHKAVAGARWTTTSAIVSTLLQIAKLSILARYLAPADFGLMAIVMIVIGFSQAFADMGISNAIIQRQNINSIQLSSLFWLNLSSGLVLTISIMACAPLITSYYGQPELNRLIMLIAPVFVINGLGNQYRVLFQKHMAFSLVAKISMLSEILAAAAAIFLAAHGLGVSSLVYSMLIGATLNSFGSTIIGMRLYHRPGFVYCHRELSGFISFGLYQMGERAVNYLSGNMDKILIGKLVGMDAVGFYNMAWNLIIFPLGKINPIVNTVTFPILSKLQDDKVTLSRYYSTSIKLLGMVIIPLLSYLFFNADSIVLLVFGQGWEQTIVLTRILSVVGIVKALGNPGGSLIMALGRPEIGFWWNIVWLVFLSIALLVGLHISAQVEMAAYMLLAATLTVGIAWHAIVAHIGQFSYVPIFGSFLRVGIVSFASGWISLLFTNQYQPALALPIPSVIMRVLISSAIMSVLYGSYLYFFERKLIASVRK